VVILTVTALFGDSTRRSFHVNEKKNDNVIYLKLLKLNSMPIDFFLHYIGYLDTFYSLSDESSKKG